MRFLPLTILALTLAVPAMAQQPAPPPATVLLPTQPTKLANGAIVPGMAQLLQYLGSRPYNEVAPYVEMLNGCISEQLPQNGTVRSGGICPAVTAALAERDKALAAKPGPKKPTAP